MDNVPHWDSVLVPATPGWTLVDSLVLSASLGSFVSLPPDSKSQGQGFDWPATTLAEE